VTQEKLGAAVDPAAVPTAGATAKFKHFVSEWPQFGILAALLITVLCFTLIDPAFFSRYNLINICLQAAVTAILAMAQTTVIITAGIDLSIGSAVALTAVVAGLLMKAGYPIPIAMLGSLAAGALAGLVNGVIITTTRITPFVVTLGMMSIFSGLALIISNGQTVYGLPGTFSNILAGKIEYIPIPIIIAFAVLIVLSVMLRSTKLGEYLVAIGGAREVARLAGINVAFYTAVAYVIATSLASIAAMITVARLSAADPIIGADLLLPSIAAAVMGGADLMGGRGSMLGAVIGALLIATLQAGLTFLNVQAFYQQLAIGVVIILALLFNRLQES
jgi:ribose transport system permease protein